MKSEAQLSEVKIRELTPLVLAFIGDGVHTLYVRERMIALHSFGAGKQHLACTKLVNAKTQSQMLDDVVSVLNEQESDIVRRAKNCKNTHTAKHADLETYNKSTAFEALLGYLYLERNEQRLTEILNIAHTGRI